MPPSSLFYSARLASPVVRGADVVVFPSRPTPLLRPSGEKPLDALHDELVLVNASSASGQPHIAQLHFGPCALAFLLSVSSIQGELSEPIARS
jgi:hypothetical protein